MAAPVIQSSFSAGELSPLLHGRVDLNKYKIGAAKMHNFLVDFRGGASKRAGSKFLGKTPYWWGEILFVPFVFNNDQTYMIEVGHGYFRFITNGGYILDAAGAIYTVGSAWVHTDLAKVKWTQSGDTLTFVHPNYQILQLVRYGHADWRLTGFSLGATIGGVGNIGLSAISTGYIDPAAVAYVNYGYAVTAIGKDGTEGLVSYIARVNGILDMAVHRVTMTITWSQVAGADYYNVYKATVGVNAQITNGSRMGFVGSTKTNTFTDTNILPNFTKAPPEHNDPFTAGQITEIIMTNGGYGYDQSWASMYVSDPTGGGAVIQPTVTHGSIIGAVVQYGGYNYTNPTVIVAQSVAQPGGSGAEMYPNVDPQYGSIYSASIYNVGAGYTANTAIQVWDAAGVGHDASVGPIISGGSIVGVNIFAGGADYISPYFTITDYSAPNNAAGYAIVGDRSGTYPSAVAYFQQRLLFAASINHPSTVWGSKPGSFHNFDISNPINDGDSFEFTLASQQMNAIKFMIPMPGGLVMLTSGGAWQLSGTQQFAPVTPTQMMATPQAFNGCADLQPIVIGYEILFVQVAGSIVRNLSYNFFANIYTGADVTVLSSHLFTNHTIKSWCYSEEPDKVIWVVRDDGALLSLTFLKDQEVAGWAVHSTAGSYKAVGCVREGTRDVVYAAVERMSAAGEIYVAIEQFQSRFSWTIEESWFLDCALTLPLYVGGATLNSGSLADPNNIFFYTLGEVPIFSAGWVGVIIRAAGGKFQVHTVYNANQLMVKQLVAPTDTFLYEETNEHRIKRQIPGTWKASGQQTAVAGLSHLEGMRVSVIADGKVQSDKIVSGGRVTLDVPASAITVGLGYQADLQTLRLESQPTVQGRRKKVPGLSVRVADTRGLAAGMTFNTLTEIKDLKPSVLSGETPSLYTGDLRIVMDPLWESDGQVCIRSTTALPANIVAVIPEVVMGDD